MKTTHAFLNSLGAEFSLLCSEHKILILGYALALALITPCFAHAEEFEVNQSAIVPALSLRYTYAFGDNKFGAVEWRNAGGQCIAQTACGR